MNDQNQFQKNISGMIEKYYDDIYRFCLYMTGHEADSYDLTQEVFLRFIRYGSCQYKNLKGYLLIIARNLCRDYFSHKKADTLELEKISQKICGESRMDRIEDRIYLLELLRELPEPQREAVVLRIYGEMKFRDIAKMSGSNLSTVKSRYKTGIESMKKRMEECGDGQ